MQQHLSEFISHFHIVKKASEHTIRNYRLDLEAFILFASTSVHCQAPIDVKRINKTLIRYYLA